MQQDLIEEYQDAYREAWLEQNKIDAPRNNMVLTGNPKIIPPQQQHEASKKNGRLGGRPRTGNKKPLTEKAKIINNMMLHGMARDAIAAMMCESPINIKRIEERFGLPRGELQGDLK